jgi:hypothetical protein
MDFEETVLSDIWFLSDRLQNQENQDRCINIGSSQSAFQLIANNISSLLARQNNWISRYFSNTKSDLFYKLISLCYLFIENINASFVFSKYLIVRNLLNLCLYSTYLKSCSIIDYNRVSSHTFVRDNYRVATISSEDIDTYRWTIDVHRGWKLVAAAMVVGKMLWILPHWLFTTRTVVTNR